MDHSAPNSFPTLEEITKDILSWDPGVSQAPEDLLAYQTLMALLFRGPYMNRKEIHSKAEEYLHLPNDARVKTFVHRAINNRVIRYGQRFQEGFADREIYEDGLGLALGVNILKGTIKRVKSERGRR